MFIKLTKRDVSILIANTLDHFDTSLYSFLAPVMAGLFFPKHEPIVQLILAYSILATSLFTRPIGAFIFGNMALSSGATRALSYSLIGVAITTFMIGCLPGYAAIGWLAPLSLILIRMIKGIFASGESTIAKLYILENKDGQEAMKASYLYQSSTILGIILASALSTIIIYTGYKEGWRLGFWLGGITGIVGYRLRYLKNNKETRSKAGFSGYTIKGLKSIWANKINILRVASVTSLSHLTYSIPFVVMNSFVPIVTSISLEVMMSLNTTLLVFDMLFIPFLGNLLRNIKPLKIMLTSSLILAITIIPLWCLIEGASLWYITFIRFWIVCLGIAFLCPQNIWLKQNFLTNDQYLLVGMGCSLSAATVGRLTPSICLSLWYFTGSSISIAIYVTAIVLVTVFTLTKTMDIDQ